MRTIWKFAVPVITRHQLITMPLGAQPLCIQTVNGSPCIYAMVNTEAPPSTLALHLLGTGHQVLAGDDAGIYLGSVQLRDATVWHAFIEISDEALIQAAQPGTVESLDRPARQVLKAFRSNPNGELSSAELGRLSYLRSGDLYPALLSLEGLGFLVSRWGDKTSDGENRRRMYRVAPIGQAAVKQLSATP